MTVMVEPLFQLELIMVMIILTLLTKELMLLWLQDSYIDLDTEPRILLDIQIIPQSPQLLWQGCLHK